MNKHLTSGLVFLFLSSLFCAPSQAAEEEEVEAADENKPKNTKTVYRYIDADGKVHYSDKPRDGAEKIEVKEINTFNMPVVKPQPSKISPPQGTTQSAFNKYKSLSLSSPENEGAIRNNGAVIPLQASISPKLKKHHFLQFYVDGRAVGKASKALSAEQTDATYGEHTAYVAVVDKTGKQLQKSETVSFAYLHVINRN